MKVKQFVKLISKDEGSGLILALMTLMVLSILGASLGVITIGSYKLGDINRDDNSAYYIAEAGANAAYDELQSTVNATYNNSFTETSFFESLEFKLQNNSEPTIYRRYYFENQFGELPEATVTIEKSGLGSSREYLIKSVGTIGQRKRTLDKNVTVTWIDKSNGEIGSSFPDITTTVAKSKMTIDNNVELTGAVHIDSEEAQLFIGNNVVMNAKVYLHPDADKENSVKWLNEDKSEIVVENRESPLDWRVYRELLASFPDFPDSSSNDEWSSVIETNGEVKTFVFDDLSLNHNLQINGGGKVNVFVKNSLSMGNVNINYGNNADQLQIFYSGVNSVKINETNFNGTLFLNQADLEIDKKPVLKGLIISGGAIVDLGKGVTLDALIIAPDAKITLGNSSNNNHIRGIIIGDEVYLVNNLKLDFSDHYLKNFPLKLPDTGSDGSDSGGGELIVTEPGVEK
ncbi:DUF7305 domain-containing protein [Alkalibacterium sp. f15]|uniref:DUF7305 domain-containing protein n=1 Tax=Alkalibacterium sp. f15 TaxID=3414029 RepID=UPI003BF80055